MMRDQTTNEAAEIRLHDNSQSWRRNKFKISNWWIDHVQALEYDQIQQMTRKRLQEQWTMSRD